jgi:hypothetical protein
MFETNPSWLLVAFVALASGCGSSSLNVEGDKPVPRVETGGTIGSIPLDRTPACADTKLTYKGIEQVTAGPGASGFYRETTGGLWTLSNRSTASTCAFGLTPPGGEATQVHTLDAVLAEAAEGFKFDASYYSMQGLQRYAGSWYLTLGAAGFGVSQKFERLAFVIKVAPDQTLTAIKVDAPAEGDQARVVALDEVDGTMRLYSAPKVFELVPSERGLALGTSHEPAWGRYGGGVGFGTGVGWAVSGRDSFESGMHAMIFAERSTNRELCVFDIEGAAPGITPRAVTMHGNLIQVLSPTVGAQGDKIDIRTFSIEKR